MGGLGTRFASAGFKEPKPLVPVDGKPMILKALSSFERIILPKKEEEDAAPEKQQQPTVSVRLIFIVRQEHEEHFQLRTKLDQVLTEWNCGPRLTWTFVMMHADTRGAVETCLLGKPVFDLTAPLVVMDCDLFVRSKSFEQCLLSLASGSVSTIGGVLVHFRSRAPRYSYALKDPVSGDVVRTAEKVPISDCSLIGAYGFGSAGLFVEAGEHLLQSPIDPEKGMKEYYVSLLYNWVIQDKGLRVVAFEQEDYASFGTPEELTLYEQGKPSYVME